MISDSQYIFGHRHLASLLENPVLKGSQSQIWFSWFDDARMIEVLGKKIQTLPKMQKEFLRIQEQLQDLKRSIFWLKQGRKVEEKSIYDLYREALFHKTLPRPTARASFIKKNHQIELSFVSAAGPFKKTLLLDCLNVNLYNTFVAVALINGELSKRDFRLRTSSQIFFEISSLSGQFSSAELVQLSPAGILLKMPFDKIQSGTEKMAIFKFFIRQDVFDLPVFNWEQFETLLKPLGHHPFFTQDPNSEFSLSLSKIRLAKRYDFEYTQEAFLFIPSSHLREANQFLAQKMFNFVSHIQRLVVEDLLLDQDLEAS
jgi:hypothetical protein